MMVILCLLVLVSTTFACSCVMPTSTEEAFCAADLVSEVKVLSFHGQGINSHTSDSAYTIQHILTYKAPNYRMRPSIVYTPSDDLCGLRMEVGKEYLLTGFRNGNNMHVYRCGQVNGGNFTGATELHTVSLEFRENLKRIQC